MKQLSFSLVKRLAAGAAMLLLASASMGQSGVSLPFTFYGGSADIQANNDVSSSGLGTDFAGEQPLCFDNNNDHLIIHLSEAPAAMAFSAKVVGNLSSNSYFCVEESDNGTAWTVISFGTLPGVRPGPSAEDFKFEFRSSTRYVKLVFSNPLAGNDCQIAVGQIRIYNRKIKIGDRGWITYYTDEAFRIPDGLSGCIIQSLSDGTLQIVRKYYSTSLANYVVPAGTPLLINGQKGEYDYVADSNTKSSPDNYLHGNMVQGQIASVADADRYYKLANGENGLGWYYGAADGGVFSMSGFKAYLAIGLSNSGTPLYAPSFDMIVDAEEEASAIEATEVREKAVKYIENGQLLIRRGEHIYTLTGLVIR